MYLPVQQSMTFNLFTTIMDWDFIAKAKTLSMYLSKATILKLYGRDKWKAEQNSQILTIAF